VASSRALLSHVVADPAQLEFLQLAVSELVTNAIVHGPGGPVDVRVARDSESVRVEVSDSGTEHFEPLGTEPSLEGRGGFGLRMVQALSDTWGVDWRPNTVAWVEVSQPV
jgi:anti-sigma regulatory factor (Ser/Thr protein kinase)